MKTLRQITSCASTKIFHSSASFLLAASSLFFRHAPSDSRVSRLRSPSRENTHIFRTRLASFDSRRHALQPARVSVRASASEGEVGDRLSEALKIAEECVDECAAMWDEVEELSQAASDKKPAPAEMDPVPIR